MNQGFTLIEILVVTIIIVLLTAFTVPNYRVGEQQLTLQRASHKLAQDIRRAQEMAMAVQEVGPTGSKIIPEGGYGIYLKKQPIEIVIFADCNNNQKFTSGEVCGSSPNKFSEKIEEIGLEPGVKIEDLIPSSPLHITFKPPNPNVFISGGDIATIILSSESDPTKTKTITINEIGLITVE